MPVINQDSFELNIDLCWLTRGAELFLYSVYPPTLLPASQHFPVTVFHFLFLICYLYNHYILLIHYLAGMLLFFLDNASAH